MCALPAKLINKSGLFPHREIKLSWGGRPSQLTPVYLFQLTVEGCKPRMEEVVYDENHSEYGLIGRNMMKNWDLTLYGRDNELEILKEH